MLTFLVVGTGRCGLGYMAQVLTYMGIPCGHRWSQGPGPRRYPHVEILGDSSPMAAPAVQAFPGLILHQVRDPVAVIGSFLGTGLLRDPKSRGVDGAFLMEHFPFSPFELGDAMRFYLNWNARCERHDRYLRYRVEDIDLNLLRRLAEVIGVDVPDATIRKALSRVPRDFNRCPTPRSISWADMPACWAKTELMGMAARFGYPSTDRTPGSTSAA